MEQGERGKKEKNVQETKRFLYRPAGGSDVYDLQCRMPNAEICLNADRAGPFEIAGSLRIVVRRVFEVELQIVLQLK